MDTLLVLQTLFVGIVATLGMDLLSQFQKRILKISPLNYALVARWVLWCFMGKLCITPSIQRRGLGGRSWQAGFSIV